MDWVFTIGIGISALLVILGLLFIILNATRRRSIKKVDRIIKKQSNSKNPAPVVQSKNVQKVGETGLSVEKVEVHAAPNTPILVQEQELGQGIVQGLEHEREQDAQEQPQVQEQEQEQPPYPSPWHAAIELAPSILSVERILKQMEETKSSPNLNQDERREKAISVLRNSEILSTLSQGISKVNKLKAEDKKKALFEELSSCVGLIPNNSTLSYGREEFDKLYPSFFEQLKNISPSLSELEERLCALIALGSSTKEMSILTRRSVRTIETAIYKIRKKLNIPGEEKTPDFLKNYLY